MISVITPVYNGERFIEFCIKVVIDQACPDVEHIIIDGGSTDRTVEIIKRYAEKCPHIRWLSEKDEGQADALNKGFDMSNGEIIGWLNADDYYEPKALEKVIELFEDSKINIISGDCRIINNETGNIRIQKSYEIRYEDLFYYWKESFCPPQPSIFFRRGVLENVGYCDKALNLAMDLDLWIRMRKDYVFTYVPVILSNYVIHTLSKTGQSDNFQRFYAEWRNVTSRYKKNLNFSQRLRLNYSYFRHLIKSRRRD